MPLPFRRLPINKPDSRKRPPDSDVTQGEEYKKNIKNVEIASQDITEPAEKELPEKQLIGETDSWFRNAVISSGMIP